MSGTEKRSESGPEASQSSTREPGTCPKCGSADGRQHDYLRRLCENCGHLGLNTEFGLDTIRPLDPAAPQPERDAEIKAAASPEEGSPAGRFKTAADDPTGGADESKL